MERRDLFLVTSGHAFSELEGADKTLARLLGKSRQTVNRMRNGQVETWLSRGLSDVWDLEVGGYNSMPLITPLLAARRVARIKRHCVDTLLEWYERVDTKEERVNVAVNQLQKVYWKERTGFRALADGFMAQAAVSLKAASIAAELAARGME